MWQILKAEIEYNKSGLTIAYTIISLFFVGTLYWSVEGVYAFMPNSAIAFAIAVAAMGSESDKEKRDRLYALLPQQISQLSIVRLLFMVLFQLTLFGYWVAIYFIENFSEDTGAIWSMISFNALVIITITQFAIYHDLGFYHSKKPRRLYLTGLLGVILLALTVRPDQSIIRLINVKEAWYVIGLYKSFFASAIGAVVSSIFCGGILALDCLIYLRRRSYLL